MEYAVNYMRTAGSRTRLFIVYVPSEESLKDLKRLCTTFAEWPVLAWWKPARTDLLW